MLNYLKGFAQRVPNLDSWTNIKTNWSFIRVNFFYTTITIFLISDFFIFAINQKPLKKKEVHKYYFIFALFFEKCMWFSINDGN